MWPFRRKAPAPVHTCEICKSEGVNRRGDWDYCPKGHIYVGERVGDGTASTLY